MRWLTALAIICICGITVAWGWQTTQFAQARAIAMGSRAGNASLVPWIGVPGLSVEALEVSLRRPSATTLPPVLREAQFSAVVAVHPMSAQAWLSLASERLVLGRLAADINSAVTMSRITGPNEGSVMWQRGLFELMRWETLSFDVQRQAAADLVGAMNGGVVDDAGVSLARTVLAGQSIEDRAKIATALGLAGMSPRQLGAIGLQTNRG